ncbi:MAG: ribonuclease III [Candidatus Absconditabacterales bacterium]
MQLQSYTSYIQKLLPACSVRDPHLLLEALTHKSFATESTRPMLHNQRLEFLGDSVLGLVIASELYKDHADFDEAQLTLWKISLVREENLYDVAKEIGLHNIILIGKGEEKKQGRDNPAILGDCLEALIGYVYLDLGFEAAATFVLQYVYSKKHTIALVGSKSWKSLLQEKLQAQYKQLPVYINEEMERDDKLNYVKYKSTVVLGDKRLGVGYGSSKKRAEEEAAKLIVEKL